MFGGVCFASHNTEGGGDFTQAGENFFRVGGAEFIGVVRAGGDNPAGQAAGLRSLHIEGRVADQERGGRLGVEQLERVVSELRLGLEPGRVGRADDGIQVRREMKMIADGA